MNRNVSGLAIWFLLAIMLVGGWLANSSDANLLTGSLLILGSAAALIFLARRENSLPLGKGERDAWEITRAKGKRPFLLRSIAYGLFIGLVFILYQLVRSRWTGEPFSARYGVLVFIVPLYIGGSYYTAMRKWALYEQRYEESRSTPELQR